MARLIDESDYCGLDLSKRRSPKVTRSAGKRELDPYTLRYVARRMRKYERHYGNQEHEKRPQAAFAAGLERMARKAADECLGTAEAIESRAKRKGRK